jgi:predicted alpha/beta superfamily hydrolase
MKQNFFIFILLILIQQNAAAQSNPVTIPGSEKRTIHSSIVNQDYELHINLPSGYANSNKNFPVVYLMDSQWDFPLVTALYGQQYFDGFIPSLIIVGVTWGGNHPNPDSLRARDYTPTNEARLPQSGGADKFLSFMKTELFPFIESNYKADNKDRTLMGSSLGGLFTIYSLLTQPQMFQRYIAVSPAFTWGNNVLSGYEQKYYESKTSQPARLFICMGSVEKSAQAFKQLTDFLSTRQYSSLSIQTRVLENIGHSGTKGEGYERGLQYVFQRPSLQLSDEVLQKYSGRYKSPDAGTVEVKTEGKQLVAYTGQNNKYVLNAASETDFYSTAEFWNMHFKQDAQGAATGFQLDRFGSSVFIPKEK